VRNYVAVIHKDDESDFGVSFPDLPGVISAAATFDEARQMAAEALAFHLEGMVAGGEPIPEPSTLEAIIADNRNRDGAAVLASTVDAITKCRKG
jgi:predicted RNase H-like HicB family nuclease